MTVEANAEGGLDPCGSLLSGHSCYRNARDGDPRQDPPVCATDCAGDLCKDAVRRRHEHQKPNHQVPSHQLAVVVGTVWNAPTPP